MNTPKDIVKAGYDKVSYAYRDDQPDDDWPKYKQWVDELKSLLPWQAAILELGCGCGLPTAKLLAQDFDVTGVDISDKQIERAKTLVPDATFLCRDMCGLDFGEESFAAIVSLYAIIHIPLEEQPDLLKKLYAWLQPGGYLLATVGFGEWTGTEKDWLNVEGGTMYWSHADRATYLQWLKEIGFMIMWDRFIPEEESGHTLILAQKPEITKNSNLA